MLDQSSELVDSKDTSDPRSEHSKHIVQPGCGYDGKQIPPESNSVVEKKAKKPKPLGLLP